MNESPTDLTGKVIAVFGTGPGIGSASAKVLADAGATIICIDRDQDAAEACAALVRGRDATAKSYAFDVLDRAVVRRTFAEVVSEFGALDGVLNVVGRSLITPTANMSDDDWSAQMDVNLRHHFVVAQEATEHLIASKGAYVAIGSFNGLNTSPNAIAYGVAKAGLISLVRNMALEYGPSGARYNVIAPGLVLTDRARSLGMDRGEIGQAFRERIPLGGLAAPEDIGYAALFLLSKMSRSMTGQAVVVDGGSSLNYFLPDLPV